MRIPVDRVAFWRPLAAEVHPDMTRPPGALNPKKKVTG